MLSIAASCPASLKLSASAACACACISPRSAPAQKTSPVPVIWMTRTSGSSAQRCNRALSPAMVARSRALRFAGRLSAICATPATVAARTHSLIGWRLDASHEFDGDRRRLAAADAQDRDAALLTARAQGIQQGGHDAGAGGPDRVTQRAGPAVDIHLCVVEAQILD